MASSKDSFRNAMVKDTLKRSNEYKKRIAKQSSDRRQQTAKNAATSENRKSIRLRTAVGHKEIQSALGHTKTHVAAKPVQSTAGRTRVSGLKIKSVGAAKPQMGATQVGKKGGRFVVVNGKKRYVHK